MRRTLSCVRWGRGARAGTPAMPHRGPNNRNARALCNLTTKRAADMASQYRIERDRGTKESSQQFVVLREKWPLAFPVQHQDIRPLAIGTTREIAATMGWSLPYTLGVLHSWKMAPLYCEAVLCHDQRIALDGAPAEAVDAEAKDLAAKRLAQLAAREAAERGGERTAPPAGKRT